MKLSFGNSKTAYFRVLLRAFEGPSSWFSAVRNQVIWPDCTPTWAINGCARTNTVQNMAPIVAETCECLFLATKASATGATPDLPLVLSRFQFILVLSSRESDSGNLWCTPSSYNLQVAPGGVLWRQASGLSSHLGCWRPHAEAVESNRMCVFILPKTHIWRNIANYCTAPMVAAGSSLSGQPDNSLGWITSRLELIYARWLMPFGHISFALVLPSRLSDLYGSYVYRHRPADIQLQTCYNLQLRRHGKQLGSWSMFFQVAWRMC